MSLSERKSRVKDYGVMELAVAFANNGMPNEDIVHSEYTGFVSDNKTHMFLIAAKDLVENEYCVTECMVYLNSDGVIAAEYPPLPIEDGFEDAVQAIIRTTQISLDRQSK